MEVKKIIKLQDADFDKKSIPSIIVFVVLVVIGIFMFFYWRSSRGIGEEEEKVTVIATVFPIYDIAKNIVGDNEYIEIVQIIPNSTDPIDYSVTDSQTDVIKNSNAVFKIGIGYDDWIDSLELSDEIDVIDLSENVELIESDKVEVSYKSICEENNGNWLEDYSECEGIGPEVCENNDGDYDECASACRHDDDTDMCIQVCIQLCKFSNDVEDSYNPYYWHSIENSKVIAGEIYKKLIDLKPTYNPELYENYSDYFQQLDETKTYIQDKVNQLSTNHIIILDDSFAYYLDEYGLTSFEIIEYTKESKEEYLNVLDDAMEVNGTNLIFKELETSNDLIDYILNNREVEIRTLDKIGGSSEVQSYIDLMKYNIDIITKNSEEE